MSVSLDKELFVRTLNLLAARMQAGSVDPVRRAVRDCVLSLPRVKTVYPDAEDKGRRLLLLAEHIKCISSLCILSLTLL